jgi:myxalamid-type polyketide synthase MxaB
LHEALKPGSFVELLLQANDDERRELLFAHLKDQVGLILSLSKDSYLDGDVAFHDLGLDSLMAVELRNALQISLEKPLSATLVLDYPTLYSLRDELLSGLISSSEETKVASKLSEHSSKLNTASAAFEDLSDFEAEALLLEELEKTNVSKQ